MNGERLFTLLGWIDEDLIQEAEDYAPQGRGALRTAAACAALLLAVGLAARLGMGFLSCGSAGPGGLTGGGNSADAGASGGGFESSDVQEPQMGEGGAAPGAMDFLSYDGPVLPLTTAEEDPGLTAERTVTWDLAAGTYPDGQKRQWGAQVTDRTVLENPTDRDVTVTALYPFVGSYADLEAIHPVLTADTGEEAVLYAGAYAGTFRGTGEDDGASWNLLDPQSLEDYEALLQDGSYQSAAWADALAETADLDLPVTVYEFTGCTAPHQDYPAATQAMTFTIDPEKTTIFTYGFNGMDQSESWRRYSFFVPDGMTRDIHPKVLVVLGEDLENYTLQGYEDGGCEREIQGVSCTVTRREANLGEVMDGLCQAYLEQNDRGTLDESQASLYRKSVRELLVQYGLLSPAPKDRYSDGRLDDILSETLVQTRVFYLALPVTVPSGGTAEVTASYWKAPSFNFGGAGNEDLQGFELAASLGSNLDPAFPEVEILHAEGVEIVQEVRDPERYALVVRAAG